MTLRQLIEQRITSSTSVFTEVAGAASIQEVLSGRTSAPSCYLFKERSSAGENGLLNIVSQRKTEVFAFIIISRNVRGERGMDSSDDNEALCNAVQTAILGWEPAGYTPFEYVSGALINFENGFFIYKESYRTSKTIRSV